MFHRESWQPIYFAVKTSKVKVTGTFAGVGRGVLRSCEHCLLFVRLTNMRDFKPNTTAGDSIRSYFLPRDAMLSRYLL